MCVLECAPCGVKEGGWQWASFSARRATAWAPVNSLLMETGSARGTLCKRHSDSGCRAFFTVLFYSLVPSASMCRPPPSQDPLCFLWNTLRDCGSSPSLLSRRLDWSFYMLGAWDNKVRLPSFVYVLEGKIIIVIALQDRLKKISLSLSRKAAMLLTQSAFKIIRESKLFSKRACFIVCLFV